MLGRGVGEQIGGANDVAAGGGEGVGEKRIGVFVELIGGGEDAAGLVEQREDHVRLGADALGGDIEDDGLSGGGVEGEAVGVAAAIELAPEADAGSGGAGGSGGGGSVVGFDFDDLWDRIDEN